MGLVYRGIHEKIALGACKEFGIRTLIETGTYRGETVEWALDKFDKIYSIELSEEFYRISEKKLEKYHHVFLIRGDTREWLGPLCLGRNNEPTLFWLDAHTTTEKSTKDPNGCAILDEIKIINENFFGIHAIMIDDCFFLEKYGWALPRDVIPLLEDVARHDRQVRIMEDVYFAAHRIPANFEEWKK